MQRSTGGILGILEASRPPPRYLVAGSSENLGLCWLLKLEGTVQGDRGT